MLKKHNPKLFKKVERIDVYLWQQFVGALALDPVLNYYVFVYDKQFAKSNIELAPLHMPLNNTETPYVFTDLPTATYRRLPALFADVLPDDFGNALLDRYLAERGITPQQTSALDRLAYMSNRAMGALEFKPARGPRTFKPSALEMETLVSSARRLLSGDLQTDDHATATLRSIIEVGTSAGGARAKAVIAWNPQTQEIRSGQVPVTEGFEHWLLKFDGMGNDKELGISQDYGRVEYAYHLMAQAAGITLSPARLLLENGRAHFMTKRFDRAPNNVKHHMQTLCAINHLDYKKKSTNSYEQLFMTMIQLRLSHTDAVEAYRRMIFNVLGRNCDDHTKNTSFLMRQGCQWELAPAYDLTFAHNPQGEWTQQHLMAINGKYHGFMLSDVMSVADRFGIGEAKRVIKQVANAIAKWGDFAAMAGVSAQTTDAIAALHLTLK